MVCKDTECFFSLQGSGSDAGCVCRERAELAGRLGGSSGGAAGGAPGHIHRWFKFSKFQTGMDFFLFNYSVLMILGATVGCGDKNVFRRNEGI